MKKYYLFLIFLLCIPFGSSATVYDVNDTLESLNAALWTKTGGAYNNEGWTTAASEAAYLTSVRTNYPSNMTCTVESKVVAAPTSGRVGLYSSTASAVMTGYDASLSTTRLVYGSYTAAKIANDTGTIILDRFIRHGWYFNTSSATRQEYRMNSTIHNLSIAHANIGTIYIGQISGVLNVNVTYRNFLCWNGTMSDEPGQVTTAAGNPCYQKMMYGNYSVIPFGGAQCIQNFGVG